MKRECMCGVKGCRQDTNEYFAPVFTKEKGMSKMRSMWGILICYSVLEIEEV